MDGKGNRRRQTCTQLKAIDTAKIERSVLRPYKT
jgi:hypothetical protein